MAEVPSIPIDIKKEIAFSILNVGEVLAKTIDYFSNDVNTEEIKDLIKLSECNSQRRVSTEENVDSVPSSAVSPVTSASASVDSMSQATREVEARSPSQESRFVDVGCSPAEPSTPVPPPELHMDLRSAQQLEVSDSTPQQECLTAGETAEELAAEESYNKVEHIEEKVHIFDLSYFLTRES